jgi:hypothetical protein
MTITTTLTWGDLKTAHRDELTDLQDAHTELREQAADEYGDEYDDHPLDSPLPDPSSAPEDLERLAVYQMLAQQYEQQVEQLQSRENLLERMAGELGEGEWVIKMLSAREASDVETELRMLAKKKEMDVQDVQHERNCLTVDAAVVDAPEDVPREDGSPVPSECPNALVMSLWEHVQAFNSAGDTGFTAGGFDADTPPSAALGSSPSPTQ